MAAPDLDIVTSLAHAKFAFFLPFFLPHPLPGKPARSAVLWCDNALERAPKNVPRIFLFPPRSKFKPHRIVRYRRHTPDVSRVLDMLKEIEGLWDMCHFTSSKRTDNACVASIL